jgi:hypothetical protein
MTYCPYNWHYTLVTLRSVLMGPVKEKMWGDQFSHTLGGKGLSSLEMTDVVSPQLHTGMG